LKTAVDDRSLHKQSSGPIERGKGFGTSDLGRKKGYLVQQRQVDNMVLIDNR
jgi:hypothetical protein